MRRCAATAARSSPAGVAAVTRTGDDRFRLDLVGGHSIIARRVLAATGLVDDLPDIEGLADHWGRDVIHCPFCHGFEVRDRRIVQIVTHPMGLHTAALFRQLTARLTVVLHGDLDIDDRELDALRSGGVEVRHAPVNRIVADNDGQVVAVELADGGRIDCDVVAVGPGFAGAEPFLPLGLQPTPHPSGLGDIVETDTTGATSRPWSLCPGRQRHRPSHQVLQAAADGSRVGAMISFSLAQEDLQAAVRPSANQTDWDHRYGGEQMWSGRPNGSLVNQIAAMTRSR